MMEILVATSNLGKVAEIQKLLADLPVKLRNLKEFGDIPEPEETGTTFEENAILKAEYYSEKTGLWALADDSGLEVEALNGAPGVYSARYAGADATNEQRIAKLLDEIKEVPDSKRQARFVCSMALYDDALQLKTLERGVCSGTIALEPSGANGFGYDPILIPDEYSETFGELSNETKQKISHRALAAAKITEFLRTFIIG